MTKTQNKTIVKVVVAALAVLLVLLIIALIINLVRLSAANERKNSLEAQYERLNEIINDNNTMIDYCGSIEFVENYARYFLDMVYRDELGITVK